MYRYNYVRLFTDNMNEDNIIELINTNDELHEAATHDQPCVAKIGGTCYEFCAQQVLGFYSDVKAELEQYRIQHNVSIWTLAVFGV